MIVPVAIPSVPSLWGLPCAALLEAGRAERCPTLFSKGEQVLIEPVYSSGSVHLFGAGHVSKEGAAVAHRVDFRVEGYDDRPEFASRGIVAELASFRATLKNPSMTPFNKAWRTFTPGALRVP